MTMLKRRHVVFSEICVVVASMISFLYLVTVHVLTVSASIGTYDGSLSNTLRPHHTIVSGYGSYRYPLTFRATGKLSHNNSLSNEVDTPLYLQSQPSLTEKLSSPSTGNFVHLHMVIKNITAKITAVEHTIETQKGLLLENSHILPILRCLDISKVDNDTFNQNEDKSNNWIPIEGLFGVYTLPSGFIIVWIVNSQQIYKAPAFNPPSDNVTTTTTTSWWQIHRISELHLTHIACSRDGTLNQTSTVVRGQRLEEKRQLNLLRKALKDHDWYYVKSDGMIIPDMTRNLQSCLLQASSLQSNHSISAESLINNTLESNGDAGNSWPGDANIGLEKPESHFFWNEALLEPIVTAEANARNDTKVLFRTLIEQVIPVTSAFCGVQTNITIDSNVHSSTSLRYDQVLISRRSRFRAGTRFTRRGADDTGAVANFAETEQILVVWKNQNNSNCFENDDRRLYGVMSHVQNRGSIPLRWSSPTDVKTYRPRVRIGTDPMAQARAFRNHLIDYATRYTLAPTSTVSRQPHPSILMVNLIDKKSDQGRLGKAMDAVLKALLDVHEAELDPTLPWLRNTFVEHLWFDFHAEVKSGRWHKLAGLLEQTKPSLNGQSFFCAVPGLVSTSKNIEATVNKLQIKTLQTGSIRTNCMDCLDRTNVVQSLFGRYILFKQLAEFKPFSLPYSYKLAFRRTPQTLPWESGEVAHRLLWADNADAISRLYAGTPALKGDFTRTGKRTRRGALDDGLNSVQRYYLNNFLDADRQEGIDLLVGNEFFSNVSEQSDGVISLQSSLITRMSIHDAARCTIVIDFKRDAKHDDDTNHVRIKVKSNLESRFGVSTANKEGLATRHLDLRWLPGDLQSQVRNLIASSDHLSIDHRETLKDIDNRASSDMPWWVVPGSTELD